MSNVRAFPQNDRHVKNFPRPQGIASSVMAICGGDFSLQQASGPMARISWADDDLARKVLFVVDEVRRECGGCAQFAVSRVSFNHDETAVLVVLELELLLSEGGSPPPDLPWLTNYDGWPLLVHAEAEERPRL